MPMSPRGGTARWMRQRKSWEASSGVGTLKAVTRHPCGLSPVITCRMVPSFPAPSIPWSTTRSACLRSAYITYWSASSFLMLSASSSSILASFFQPWVSAGSHWSSETVLPGRMRSLSDSDIGLLGERAAQHILSHHGVQSPKPKEIPMRRMLVAAGLLTALVACNKQDQGGVQSAPTDPTALLNPAALNAQAPAAYRAKFETSAGDFTIEVTRAWAPLGADRLYNLIKNGFYDGDRLFRVVPGFVVQFGLNGNPTVSAAWRHATIQDDP